MNTPKTHSFRIANMDCASEESEIRHALNDVAGIQRLQFNLVEKQLDISADDLALEKAIKAIRGAALSRRKCCLPKTMRTWMQPFPLAFGPAGAS